MFKIGSVWPSLKKESLHSDMEEGLYNYSKSQKGPVHLVFAGSKKEKVLSVEEMSFYGPQYNTGGR